MRNCKKQVIIIGNGVVPRYPPLNLQIGIGAYLIAADGGIKHLIREHILPNLIIGDLDSLSNAMRKFIINNNIPLISFPKDKDKTDLELALQKAISFNPKEIVFIGVLGGRWDQTLVNLCILEQCLEKGIKCRIVHGPTTIWLINNTITINTFPDDTISLHPLSQEVKDITTYGLKYPLEKENLKRIHSRGISNVAAKTKVKIEIKDGLLWVFHARGKRNSTA